MAFQSESNQVVQSFTAGKKKTGSDLEREQESHISLGKESITAAAGACICGSMYRELALKRLLFFPPPK